MKKKINWLFCYVSFCDLRHWKTAKYPHIMDGGKTEAAYHSCKIKTPWYKIKLYSYSLSLNSYLNQFEWQRRGTKQPTFQVFATTTICSETGLARVIAGQSCLATVSSLTAVWVQIITIGNEIKNWGMMGRNWLSLFIFALWSSKQHWRCGLP